VSSRRKVEVSGGRIEAPEAPALERTRQPGGLGPSLLQCR
jgi:hypothetical protein